MAKEIIIQTTMELALLNAEVMKILNKGRAVKCEVKSTASKTNEQLGYYWSVIVPKVQDKFREDGDRRSRGEINDFFNYEFYYQENIVFGRAIRKAKSKSGATIEQMSEFLERVIQWCNEQGVYIPEPHEYDF